MSEGVLEARANGPVNAGALAADAQRELWTLRTLCVPALVLVGVMLLIPFAWLSWLSFMDAGTFSLVHYQRLTHVSYVRVFVTTFELAFVVTAICVALGYPVSYLLSQLGPRKAHMGLIFVLLPFWTSLLVRNYAWLVLLQRKGVVNVLLEQTGIVDGPLSLTYNFGATVIGMVHVLLPFLILPLYASMKQIEPDYLRAAASLGASPRRVFWEVFFPLSLPGLFAGMALVFVLSLGFYVTPAILGGGKVLTWPLKIADAVAMFANWGAASAMGVVLLLVTLGLLYGLGRIFRLGRIGAGMG